MILDATARAFIAVTGTLDKTGAMHGAGTHAGPPPLLKRIARLIAEGEHSPAEIQPNRTRARG